MEQPMQPYHTCAHNDVPGPEQFLVALSELDTLTFSHYEGVVHATPSFLRWYTSRPGMLAHLSQAAFAGDMLVCSVFATLAPMMLGGGTVLCGIIDTVMTHPDHRRRGLATQLLRRALAAVEEAGADVSLLYAARGEPLLPPERLYRGLGYQPRELVTRYRRRAGPISGGEARVDRLDASARPFFEGALGRLDGWLVLDNDLWRWRRIERPEGYPVGLYATDSGAAAAICSGDLTTAGAPAPVTVVSDLVLPDRNREREDLRALIAAAPQDAPVMILCPESSHRAELLIELGFAAAGVEVAMIRPISRKGAAAASAPRSEWYVAVESLIGV
jgi:GNAT superfamily N-acetyltransferase